jgi:hypothetical protein
LENAQHTVSASIQITTKGGQTYAVNFATMEQTNVRTNFVRRIKRCEKQSFQRTIFFGGSGGWM